jgi:hypothetical protein
MTMMSDSNFRGGPDILSEGINGIDLKNRDLRASTFETDLGFEEEFH